MELKELILNAIDAKMGVNPVVINMENRSVFCDYFIICTASSLRQTNAIADHIEFEVKQAGYTIGHIEGADGSGWLLMDLGEIIVHIFTEETRDFYALEKLWF